MIAVEEATSVILNHLYRPAPVDVSLTEATGRVLAETISADRDFPPFHRVTMDGIAVNYQAWADGFRSFMIEDLQAAGQPQKKLSNPANAIEVMTGAVLPEGADTVIRYEDLSLADGRATVMISEVHPRQNVHLQAQDVRKGDVLLHPGAVLSPADVALMASVGKSRVQVLAFPSTAIISTGDELVDIETQPQLHQVRRSNVYAVQAAMREMHWKSSMFHLPDEKETILMAMKDIVAVHDLIVLSGGVSKGKFDYIPAVLEEIGIRQLFHGVSQRPGKPFWFGVSSEGKTVFALPGNPVSTFLCFYRYVRPWVYKSLGVDHLTAYARLGADVSFAPALTYFLQVELMNEQGTLVAYPRAGGGSGDFANLKNVHGFLELPAGKTHFKAGEVYPLVAFRVLY